MMKNQLQDHHCRHIRTFIAMSGALVMRDTFQYASRMATHWYPGHMAKGLKAMQENLRKCDVVLEIHDARLPISGRNHQFDLLQGKPRVLVLNKADLADPKYERAIERYYHAHGTPVIFTSCAQQSSPALQSVAREVIKVVDGKTIQQREFPCVRIMVAGLPNVGKSSMINALRRTFARKGKAAVTGAMAGITRAVLTDIRINNDPPVYVIDTPGIMLPNILDQDVALKLALLSTMKDEQVGEELIADFLLYTLNKHGNFSYVDKLKMAGPSDNIDVVLDATARRIGALQAGGVPNPTAAAKYLIQKYREGYFGRMTLESIPSV